ncbi:hypothetical protein AMECASPLE_033364, partial [Ameca splendens]
EVDRIIAQMMRAADYLGWDVTELRPVLKDMMSAIDVDDSGTVTLEEWVKGGLNNVPLLVLLGLRMTEKDGQHIWRLKHFNKPTYCGVCENMLLGLGKQGLYCNYCAYTVHNQCANKNPEPCARTFVKNKQEIGKATHDWIKADCNSSKCQVCFKKIKTLAGKHCVWCQEMVRMALWILCHKAERWMETYLVTKFGLFLSDMMTVLCLGYRNVTVAH